MNIIRHYFLIFALLCCFSKTFAQKPVLTADDITHWPRIDDNKQISNDGRYLTYSVSDNSNHNLYLKSLKDDFIQPIGNADASFTEDSRELLVMMHDSLGRFDLRSRKWRFIPGVRSYQVPERGGLPVLAYQQNDSSLAVLNRITGRLQKFDRVKDYAFSGNGKVLLVTQQTGEAEQTIWWLDLTTGGAKLAWKGPEAYDHVFSPSNLQLALVTEKNKSGRHCSIWAYDSREQGTARLAVREETNLDTGYSVAIGDISFSQDGTRLFFDEYHLADTIGAKPNTIKVDVWNYQDENLQSQQLYELDDVRHRRYLSVVDLSSGKVSRLVNQTDSRWSTDVAPGGNYVKTATESNGGEASFFPNQRSDIYLTETRTGNRVCILDKVQLGSEGQVSPGGKYLVRYEAGSGKLSFYNLAKRQQRTVSLPFKEEDFNIDKGLKMLYGYGVWLEGDRAMLVYDQFDIWQVDPEGNRPPVNITNGYGKAHGIQFRPILTGPQRGTILKIKDAMILSAVDENNLDNGFYRAATGKPADPERLSMNPDFKFVAEPGGSPWDASNNTFLKARDTDTFVLTQQTAEKSPNINITHDFKTFKPVTNICPEKKVNWLTTELVKWKMLDGKLGQGILYKPEDFDSTKRYPVIFYYYAEVSSGLHVYLYPDISGTVINIPWYVSHGYLVFCPDITYTWGGDGPGIYNSVVSAAEMMKQKSWVDGNHMGIEGHSYGGYETYYLVTKTALFAAASAGSGFSDLISNSGERELGVGAGEISTELGQLQMAVPFWKNLQGYIDNSPLFGVENVTTPLLMMANKNDGNVPWEQGVEFFTALRRLGKTAFMLQYDNGGHGVDGADGIDYSKRMMQFFDHYLKGAPEPKWMAEGIPARLKGVDDGLELEPTTEVKPAN